MRAGKSLERRRDVGEAHTHLDRHRRRRGRVGDVVPAALAKVDATELAALMRDAEGSLAAAAVIRRFGEAVGHLPRGRRQGDGAFVVRRQHRQTVGRQPADELGKEIAHSVHVLEMVGVIELDVGDDRPFRMMHDQRSVRLVDLGHQPARAARPRMAAVADKDSRVEAGIGQDVARHVGDRRLAVASGDGDRVGLRDETGQRLRARVDLDTHRTRGDQLGRVFPHRSAVDEEVLAEDVLRVVPHLDRDPGILQLGGGVRLLDVATTHLVATG